MINKTPSPFKIIFADYFCFLCTIFSILIGAVVGYEKLFDATQTEANPETWYFILLSAGGAAGTCMVLLVCRIRLIRAVFERGANVRGKCESIKNNKRRGLSLNSRVTFSYVYQGRSYKKRRYVLSSENISSGKYVQIVVDPNKPKQAFLRDIFL